ncbi:MAG: hypothetical protein QOI10_4028 [Solirubrobacterales bacterium]|nr:hypothetical protein [Pseudonocardia sp.]MDX6584844.1 hypothetical protein [Solirubrobacterales bacterium]
MMANTTTHAARRAAGGARPATRGVATDPVREAARRAISEVGGRVLGVAADRVISRVEGVAGRLDHVAESGTGLREALTGRPATTRPEEESEVAGAGAIVPAGIGAAFSLMLYRAAQLLRFVQRLALQLLEALQHLISRSGPAPTGSEAGAGGDQSPMENDTGEDTEPSAHRDRPTKRRGRPSRGRDGRND